MSSNRVSSLLRLALCVSCALTATACASTGPERAEQAVLPTEQFKTTVTTQPEEVLLSPHADGLSPAQQAAVFELIDHWRSRAAGPITVQTPVAGNDDTFEATAKIDAFLQAYGVSEHDLRFKRYEAGPDPRAPIRVGFSAYAVDIPRCGQAWANLANNFDNQVTPNFGCAVTANIAAMVAKPSDLMYPQPSTPSDASRRQVVLEKYRQGQVTSSAKDEQAQGSVSHAVN